PSYLCLSFWERQLKTRLSLVITFFNVEFIFSGIYWPDYWVINSDHTIVHSILLTENLFDGKASAKLKQQDVGRKVIDYASTTTEHWSLFAEEIDKIICEEISLYSYLPISNIMDSST